jgi:hypothetical protein
MLRGVGLLAPVGFPYQALSMTLEASRTRVKLDEAELDDLAARLARARLPRSDTSSWVRGTPMPWLAELIDDWRAFDPGRLQDALDRLTHIEVTLDGLSIHGFTRRDRVERPRRYCLLMAGRARSWSMWPCFPS